MNTESDKSSAQRKWIRITVESVLGQSFQISAAPFERVLNLKERIEYAKGISASQQRLVYQSVELQNDSTVEELKIQDGAKLTLIPAMRGGPLNFRRVELKESMNPEILKRLAEVTSEETNSGKPPVVVMVVHDGQLLNFFQFHDSDSSFESISSSFYEIDEDLEEEEEDLEKKKKEENDRLQQKVAALRKRMDSIAIDKGKVDLPKPVPPPLNRESGIRKISQATSAKPTTKHHNQDDFSETNVNGMPTPQSIHRPSEPIDLRRTPGSSHLSGNKTSTLIRQSPEDAGSRKSVFQKSHNLLQDGRRKFSVGSNQSGTLSSTRFGGSLPQMRAQRSFPTNVRRLSLPVKSSRQRGSYDGTAYRKRNSMLSDHIEITVPPAINSSSYRALNNYLMLADTFPGGSRYHQPLETVTSQTKSRTLATLNSATVVDAGQEQATETDISKKSVTRCAVCSKKTGLASTYECRCKKIFCAVHRYPESHNCSYDYKGEGRKELKENNPAVTASKLPKI